MPQLDASLIELLLAPAVLIPACALLAMSTSARLSAILARVRDLHRQRLEAYALDDDISERRKQVRKLRLEGLEVQAHDLIRRAQLTRLALQLIYASIAALLASSLALGAALAWPSFANVSQVMFGVGLALLFVAVMVAMRDVSRALRWVQYEHERIAGLDAGGPHHHE